MKESFEKLVTDTKRFTLLPQEKEAMRKEVVLFMYARPIKTRFGMSFARRIQNLFFLRTKYPLSTVPAFLSILLVICGSAATFAAEKSLPGELLYAVKTDVNEPMRGLFSFSQEAKAEWHTRLVERRLEEAEKLIEKGKWQHDARVSIEARIEESSANAWRHISATDAQGKSDVAEDASGRLEVSLKTHKKIVAALAEKKKESEEEVNPLLRILEKNADTSASVRTTLEEKLLKKNEDGGKTHVQKKVESAARELADAKALITRTRSQKPKTVARREKALANAQDVFIKGKKALGEGRLKEAFDQSQESLRIVQESNLMLKADENLKNDIDPDVLSTNDNSSSSDVTTTLLNPSEIKTPLPTPTLPLLDNDNAEKNNK